MSNTASALRIHDVVRESIVDGPGIRYVIFVQGCPHCCEGCHNPQTHDFAGGHIADTAAILAELRENPLLAGATFSGGEPFCQGEALAEIGRAVHAMGKTVMSFSGWTLQELLDKAGREAGVKALLMETDILVDGPFILAARDLSLEFRGSRNQRIIDLRAWRTENPGALA